MLINNKYPPLPGLPLSSSSAITYGAHLFVSTFFTGVLEQIVSEEIIEQQIHVHARLRLVIRHGEGEVPKELAAVDNSQKSELWSFHVGSVIGS